MRSYSIYKHDTTLKMAFGAIFFPPILIPDPLLLDSGSDGDLIFVNKDKLMLLPYLKRLVPQS